jgi:hypothetical protein
MGPIPTLSPSVGWRSNGDGVAALDGSSTEAVTRSSVSVKVHPPS